ncbi:MAG: tRNA (N(6)-L-threonylcarbamoyladenosine(37)-C(2))-methylthiotransferase MtaB [Coriobacteriia bacterium]|nr:tRNA (N(6)-L-threonylcarbamoyladenosine(37)-C(2))-methylthiotransferase MtaB [Coriobacteriia bacterium]
MTTRTRRVSVDQGRWRMNAGFFVHNLGCKVNRVESDLIHAKLLAKGACATSRDEADVIIINTCTVTAEADSKTRKAVRQAVTAPKAPWVVVTGCSAVLQSKNLASLGSRVIVEADRTVALKRAYTLLQSIGQEPDTPVVPSGIESDEHGSTNLNIPPSRIGFGFNTRVGVKIQDGCDNRCSFCIVSTARGPARSTPVQEVISEVSSIARSGARELVFTGVNMGTYASGGLDLVALLQACLIVAPKTRIRLSSIEPLHVSHELIDLMAASSGRICAHLHLPLQSGSDRILRLMNRPYTTGQFTDVIAYAQNVLPNLAITTDVIVGFPGETEQDFDQTLELCTSIGFSKIHVFRYSKRPGTPAATMMNQVPAPEKAKRSHHLIELSDRMAAFDAARRVGITENVLIERAGRGTSESYHTVELTREYTPGSLVPIEFTAHRGAILIG